MSLGLYTHAHILFPSPIPHAIRILRSTYEDKDKRLTHSTPKVAIVQDADRLDAIGAVGIGRCFAFGGAKDRPMEETMRHFDDKLIRIEGIMKTETGRTMARERCERLRLFKSWWEGETAMLEEDN